MFLAGLCNYSLGIPSVSGPPVHRPRRPCLPADQRPSLVRTRTDRVFHRRGRERHHHQRGQHRGPQQQQRLLRRQGRDQGHGAQIQQGIMAFSSSLQQQQFAKLRVGTKN